MIQHKDLDDPRTREVIIIGGGIAGLSAAIYLGRAQRDTLVIDSGHSMAKWEPVVENYLGFPDGVAGEELLKNGRKQAERHEVRFAEDEIKEVRSEEVRTVRRLFWIAVGAGAGVYVARQLRQTAQNFTYLKNRLAAGEIALPDGAAALSSFGRDPVGSTGRRTVQVPVGDVHPVVPGSSR